MAGPYGETTRMTARRISSKKVTFGYNVSHSKRHTKRTWKPNMQRATIEIDGRRQQVYIAARDLRALFKPPRKSKSA